ncbi:MAG: hypothetical protein M1817_004482 [Caeruleum heppii]|nr:MAG: hypothetical protein M1817_004482 [Caeruleum heppii]
MKNILGLLILLVAAAETAPVVLESRAVPSDVFDNLVLYSQWSAAAYCPGNNDSPNTEVTCPIGNCPLVEAFNTSTTTEFENSLFTDTTGYVAIDNTNRRIVLAFRGSQSVQNFLADAIFLLDFTDLCKNCMVHHGFWKSWLEIRGIVLNALRRAVEANPGYAVFATGHSLGGALAALAAAEARKQGIPMALYTYGQPRIGNRATSAFISSQPGGNYRVTHTDDPVPRLPPLTFGYVHISPEYWISKGEAVVNPNDILVLEGSVNWRGNTGTGGFNVDAHGTYFGEIADCGPGLGFEKE